MKRIFFIIIIFAVVVASCSDNSKKTIEKLQHEKDSIFSIKKNQDKILNDLTSVLLDVSISLDSVSAEERTLRKKIEDGTYSSKLELFENLRNFKEMVASCRLRLNEMENQLSSRNDQLSNLSEMIKFLNLELSKKEETISNLQKQLAKKNVDIAHLKGEIVKLGSSVSKLEKSNINQGKEIEKLNEVYYIVGTSKELKSKGVLTGGFLKKKKVDYSSLNMKLFTKADMRNLLKIEIPAKSAKVYTNATSDSYSIENISGNSCILNILNPEKFWSTSKILVIQAK